MRLQVLLSFVIFLFCEVTLAEDLSDVCQLKMNLFPGVHKKELTQSVCKKVEIVSPQCHSVEGVPIFHYDKIGNDKNGKRILVFSLIHGDEQEAGTLGRYWMERLEEIDSRNTWRVVPMLNPDGYKYKTRTNANKIDLNRNFPTKDWNELANKYWKMTTSSNPRRFPGDKAGSEPEVNCALEEIQNFQPDFIISIHTPLSVLDFDGPKVKKPHYDYLPWKSLGHFPGSLGRYMWFERQTPVLTLELRESLPSGYSQFEKLQDVIGSIVKLELNAKKSK